MSIPVTYGDGPHGEEVLITVSRRTVLLLTIGALSIIFALGTIVWVIFGIYRDAIHDRDVANSTTACARQLNADALANIGLTITSLGDLDSQLGLTIKSLVNPDPQQRASEFATEAGKLQPFSDKLKNQAQLTKDKLNKIQQVNILCEKG